MAAHTAPIMAWELLVMWVCYEEAVGHAPRVAWPKVPEGPEGPDATRIGGNRRPAYDGFTAAARCRAVGRYCAT
ncbi:hypothetical protein GCM10010303_79580 [Streptomyces purpurascens]|nr:hypothetical protein GCM10010303_79580 [Streptomyces purpurascens]